MKRIPSHIAARMRTVAPAIGAFSLVAVGTLIALPDDQSGKTPDLVPTVVATAVVEAGSSSNLLRNHVEVRDIAPSARADGALTSIEQIPDGVVTYDIVSGQQVLETSFSATSVAALGDGYVAVSVRLNPQQWVGPVIVAGNVVDVYDVFNEDTTLVAHRAVILDAPDVTSVEPNDETIVSLGVKRESLPDVLVAATNNRIWLTGV